MLNKIKKLRGFTLIELIIVIAIIAILAAIAVPAFGQIRQKANASADLGNARTIYSLVATEIASDNITLPTGNDAVVYALTGVGGVANTSEKVESDVAGNGKVNIQLQIDPKPIVKTKQGTDFVVKLNKDGKIEVGYAIVKLTDTQVNITGFDLVYPKAN